MIDRLSPRIRPDRAPAGTQRWRSLLFLHWEVPVQTLRALVPEDLEIDTFDGRGFVGLVPFEMRDIKPSWLPRSLAFNFLETNVRTYVVHRGRPGVYFFSLDANSRLAVWAARAGWSLPYRYSVMTSNANELGEQCYTSCRPRTQGSSRVRFSIADELGVSEDETIESFLLERYLLFVKHRDAIYEGQVHHAPYVARQVCLHEVEDSLVSAAGFRELAGLPAMSHYSDGVDVEVFSIQRCQP